MDLQGGEDRLWEPTFQMAPRDCCPLVYPGVSSHTAGGGLTQQDAVTGVGGAVASVEAPVLFTCIILKIYFIGLCSHVHKRTKQGGEMALRLGALASRGPKFCSPRASYAHTNDCCSSLKYHQPALFETGSLAGLELDKLVSSAGLGAVGLCLSPPHQ